jgi:hypothetical protein
MKAVRIIPVLILLTIFFSGFVGDPIQPAQADDLLLQIYVDKGSYNQGENIYYEMKLSMNGYGIASAQMCVELANATGETLWGACDISNIDGFIFGTLEYGFAIPEGYSGNLILSATGSYDEQTTYSEMSIPYGVGGGGGDDDDFELSLSLYPFDKPEFALGESPTIGGELLIDGQPLANTQVCVEVWGDALEYMHGDCYFTNGNGQFSFWLEYGVSIPTGYRGNLLVEGNATYNAAIVYENIYVPYGQEASILPLDIQLFGPDQPIQKGSADEIGIAGIVSSQGARVDGATVTMQVNGQTFQTTTGTYASGEFNWFWKNNSFPAGNHVILVTISKDGYQAATGEIPFTLLGEDYDYWVNMDAIQATYPPSTNVPFSGILTLGGNPAADWIESDVTFPNGAIETFINLSTADGRFTLTLPSMQATGTYQLVVFYQADRKQISQVYTWTVGATPTPTVTPKAPKPIQVAKACEIVEVQYPAQVTAGDTLNVTGKVVCTQGEDEITPQAGWYVTVSSRAPYQSPITAPKVQTGMDGIFSAALIVDNFFHEEIFIVATDQEDGWTRKDYWLGPLKVVVGLEPDLRLSQTDYDTGELVQGTLILNPSSYAQGWDAGLKIIYQIVGPIGGAEQLYLFESPGNYADGRDQFYWQLPFNAEFGDYKITAFISGSHIPTHNVEGKFWVNDIRHTTVTAFVEPGSDEWSSAYLMGEYLDADDAPIPDAEVRVTFQEKKPPGREFTLTGRTDPDGFFAIDLEPLDLFAGQGQGDPWLTRYWLTTVSADKEGFATGSTFLDVATPTITPYLEIVAIDPPLDYLSKLTAGGINYTEQLDMDIAVTVRYNNIYDGGQLDLLAMGNWTVSCVGGNDWTAPGRKAHLTINGESPAEWNPFTTRIHLRSWTDIAYNDIHPRAYYWYPSLETKMDANKGFGEESTILVSGQVFGYSHESANPCNSSVSNPNQPPEWLAVNWSGVIIEIGLGRSEASVHYRLSPPTLGVSGQAWVSPTDGLLDAEIRVGQATGYAIPDQNVELSIIAKDLTTGTETPSTEITVATTAKTDEKGLIKLPLTATTNPCELEKKAKYFVKITSSEIEGEQKIPIELRCIEKLEFKTNDEFISLVQATDLTDYPPLLLAAGKEAGVRVYYAVEGEIYQPENIPAKFDIKFELLQPGTNKPLVTQLKKVAITEKGATAAWANPAKAANQAGIGELIPWENKPTGIEGKDSSYIDFVFTPRQASGKSGNFKIRITIDPEEVYGKKVEADIEGTVLNMKTLRLIIVPVDVYDLDMGFVLEQTAFLHETYPLGLSNLILDPRDIYESSQIPTTCASITLWKEIACGVGREYGVSTNANDPVKVIAIVDSATWLQVNKAFLYAGGIGALGTYDAEMWDSATNNVVVIRYPENVPNTSAHEIAHAYGLEPSEQYKQHPPHGLPVTGLILKEGRILDLTGNLGSKEPSSRTNMRKSGLGGVSELYDLMGNAGYHQDAVDNSIQHDSYQQSWVVFKTYNSLLQALKDPIDESVFFVQGVIGLDGLVHLDPVVQTIGIPTEPSTAGDYELQLRASDGNVLYSTRFGYLTKPGLFNIQLPYTAGLGRLVVLHGTTVVGELIRSPNAPEIIFSPIPALGYDDTSLNLSWNASDLDGDPLTYSLGYNCDGTDVWVPLAANRTDPFYAVNLSQISEGICTFKVTASDGLNSAFAISESFSGTAQGPLVQIVATDDSYPVDEPVIITAQAYDRDDGAIPPDNIHWSSDRDGDLGTGNPLTAILSEGTHNLTLYALDSNGNVSVATATIQVQEGGENILTGMGSGLQSLWVVGCIGLVVIAICVLGIIWLVRRNRNTSRPARVQAGADQYNRVQDGQGRWWHQNQNTGQWNIWNGKAWQPAPGVIPSIPAPQRAPKTQPAGGRGGSCLLSLLIGAVIAGLVFGGISLVAFEFFPGTEITLGTGDMQQILTIGGGGLLILVLGTLLIYGGVNAILTRRATVEDDWGHRREKRGCGAVLNGLSRLFFGVLFLAGGLGMLALVFYQEVWVLLGF